MFTGGKWHASLRWPTLNVLHALAQWHWGDPENPLSLNAWRSFFPLTAVGCHLNILYYTVVWVPPFSLSRYHQIPFYFFLFFFTHLTLFYTWPSSCIMCMYCIYSTIFVSLSSQGLKNHVIVSWLHDTMSLNISLKDHFDEIPLKLPTSNVKQAHLPHGTYCIFYRSGHVTHVC